MSDRVRELDARQAVLEQRCAAQRAAIAHEIASIETRLAVVDRTVVLARNTILHPAVLVAGAATVLFVGRMRGFGLLGRLLLLAAAARRLAVAARRL